MSRHTYVVVGTPDPLRIPSRRLVSLTIDEAGRMLERGFVLRHATPEEVEAQ